MAISLESGRMIFNNPKTHFGLTNFVTIYSALCSSCRTYTYSYINYWKLVMMANNCQVLGFHVILRIIV